MIIKDCFFTLLKISIETLPGVQEVYNQMLGKQHKLERNHHQFGYHLKKIGQIDQLYQQLPYQHK
jgi:hypothetical protein